MNYNSRIVLYLLTLGVALVTAIPATSAQTAPASKLATSESTELLLDGDDIVTTATRTAQRVSDSPAAVTVISADDIAASGATSIPELLRSVPGVDVMEPNLSQVNVAIRGFNNDYSNTVLVMVDGRRINEDFNDSVFWNTDPILLSRIKRIEIVRGPGSVLYGADAFSGVINIILKTPDELVKENKPGTFVGQYQNHATDFAEGVYTVASKGDDWAATLAAGYHGLTGPHTGQVNQVQDSSSVPIYTLDIQRKTPRGSLLFSVDDAVAKADLSTSLLIPDGKFNTNTVALAYDEDRGANPVTARYYSNVFRFSGSNSFGNAQSNEFDIQQLRPLSVRNSLTYGASYRLNEAKASASGPDSHSEHVSSLFLQLQSQLSSRTTLFAGVRDDVHSVYGTQFSSRASLVDHVSSAQSVRLSYGTAFKAPTYQNEYLDYSSPVLPGLSINYIENTSIKPEQIRSSEAGYRFDLPKGYVGVNVFYNEISDVIVPVPLQFSSAPYPVGIPLEYQFQNQGNAHAAGLEFEGAFPLNYGWSGLANYSYQDEQSDNHASEDFSPHDKVNLVLQSDQNRRVSTYFAGHFVGSSTSGGDNLRPYFTVDARMAYRLGRSQDAWTAALSSTNLLDDTHKEYTDQAGLSQSQEISEPAERSLRVELSGKF
jgi:outer membrane receptor for ferrienterochelin and colicin